MRVAILCEYSGIVRDAFISKGHKAISCDLLPTERPGPHYQGDVFEFLDRYDDEYFDLAITHAPCTRLCNSGVLRLYVGGKKENGIDLQKWEDMLAGALFFKKLLETRKAKKLCAENPVMHGYAVSVIGCKQSQIIQPYNFGEDASKATGLWLRGLPLLKNTSYFHPRIVEAGPYAWKKRWSNQTDSGQNRLGPGENRGKDRAKTYVGIAEAMAEQWSDL
jgi:hypothetical protein